MTKCVAEKWGCCDSVAPAGAAQSRKSIGRMSYSEGILLHPRTAGISEEIFQMRDPDSGCQWMDHCCILKFKRRRGHAENRYEHVRLEDSYF